MATAISTRIVITLAIALAICAVVALINIVVIVYGGTAVPAPTIPRTAAHYGSGQSLTYVVIGDSTTIGQGSDYSASYAPVTAKFIATQGYAVTFYNFGISGARATDVASKQIPEAARVHPAVVLIAVGANDVTHLSSISSVRQNLSVSIDALRRANPKVKIILTGSPQMGAVPRFPQPTRLLAKLRTNRLNQAVSALANDKNVTFAPIAAQTGPIFAAHPEYFAADRFHPNAQGYAVWVPVLEAALRRALAH